MTRPDTDLPAPSPALLHLVSEVRAQEPNVDWDRVSAGLYLADGSVRAPRPVERGWPRIAAALALAASFAIALTAPSRDVAPRTSVEATARPAVELSAGGSRTSLRTGADITVGADGAWIEVKGRLRAHLSAGTRARLVDGGERLHFSLVSGAIAADVTPVPGGEPFAIDVGGRRVAVHGTHLLVAVRGAVLEVAVSEGSAVVGRATGRGRTEGTVVAAGAIAAFADGGEPVVWNEPARAEALVDAALRREAVVALGGPAPAGSPVATATSSHEPARPVATAAPTGKGSVDATSSASASAPPALLGLSDAEVALVLPKLDAAASACARPVGPGKSYRIQTVLTLTVAAGKPSDATFDPPLDVPVRDCVRGKVFAIAFPVAPGTSTIKKALTIGAE